VFIGSCVYLVVYSKFSCDICINNILALHNTHMIAQYSRVDSRLLQLGYFIKHWTKCRKLDEPYTGTLSSYAWILLVRVRVQAWCAMCARAFV
jgi:DNA polymerase sigma